MRKIIRVFFFFCLLSSFSSCFDLIEEINMNADGSGNMVITLNLSESKPKVASILKMKTVNGHPVPSETEIKNKLREVMHGIKQVDGISDLMITTNFNDYIVVMSFKFTDVAKVNAVTAKLWKEYKIKATNAAVYSYDKQRKTFSRAYSHNAQTLRSYNALSPADKRIFENADYTSIYRFATPVITRTNAASNISKSHKAVMQKVPMLSVIKGSSNLSNSIKLQ